MMSAGLLVPDSTILKLILSSLTTSGHLTAHPPLPKSLNPGTTYARSTSFAEHDSQEELFTPNPSPSASFILDGFPRTAVQAASLDALVPVNFVVHLSTPTEVILDRIRNRWVHAPSGRVYNLTFNPPKVDGKDDVTGEQLTRREDDNEEVWKRRLKGFEEQSQGLLDFYGRKGLLWKVEGRSSDEISPLLFEEFERRFGGEEEVQSARAKVGKSQIAEADERSSRSAIVAAAVA